jgi:hypothetical protein
MDDESYQLCWMDQVVGIVTDIQCSDFPWAEGKLTVVGLSGQLRAVLAWLSEQVNSEDDLEDPPFPAELVENWFLVKADGTKHNIILPAVDLVQGTVSFPAVALLG